MFAVGDVISYLEMCQEEGTQLQRGMNFQLRSGHSVVLMSRRNDAPYADAVADDGQTIVYEGHDTPRAQDTSIPKLLDQPAQHASGRLTQNGLFEKAANDFRAGGRPAEHVRVYEKLYPGIWVFNGTFALTSADRVREDDRLVFKFRLELIDEYATETESHRPRNVADLPHARVIPSEVKLAVWRRDQGRCVRCKATDNLNFDHVLPYSRGGASITADNVQILCARHNLEKGARIE